MRRATRAASSWAACLVLSTATAHATPWVVTAEGGAEADNNVQRVETGAGLPTQRLAAPVGRLGARLDHKDAIAGGGYALSLSTLARVVGNPDASAENVALFTGDLRWLRRIESRSLAIGFGLTAADAIPITDEVGARTFSNLGADGLLVLDGGHERHLTLGFGGRRFRYKENHDFDWSGPSATVRLDLPLWQPSGGTRSLELATTLGFEPRDYNSNALSNACPRGAPPNTDCSAPTSLQRHDRFERAGIDVTWVGRIVAAAGYQLTVIDSNSYGQSVARHKMSVSATMPLPFDMYGTGLAQLQIDQYLDGLVVKKDLQRSEFTSLDDENRSSLQARIGKPVSAAWSIEGRAAVWRDLGGTMDTTFRRALVYVGAVYSH
jgi:hypothetical protein